MYRLIIDYLVDPVEVPLAPDFSVNMVLNNSLIGAKQSGSFVFPFSLPISRPLQLKFGFPELPSSTTNRKQAFTTVILKGSLEIFSGFINLRKATHKGYEVDITKTPGNVKKNVWEQKLSEINFGQEILDSSLLSPSFYYLRLDSYNYTEDNQGFLPWGPIFSTNEPMKIQKIIELAVPLIKIFINNVQVSSHYIAQPIAYYSSYEEFLSEEMTNWAASFNSELYECTIKLDRFKREKSMFAIKILNQSTVVTSVRFELWTATNPDSNGQQYEIKADEYFLSRLQYQDVSNALISTPPNKPYKFVSYNNADFYDSSLNGTYTGIVNEYLNGILRVNTYTNPSAHALSPCFQLKFIFEKLVDEIGYNLIYTTNIWNAIRSSIYLFTNVALDKQLDLLSELVPFNIYGEVIDFKFFMPDWTIREFFDSFRIINGISLEFNDLQKTLTVKSFKDIINSTDIINIASKVAFAPLCNISDPTNYQLCFANAEQTNDVQKSFPTDDIVNNSDINYQKLETKLKPGVFITDTDTTQTERGILVHNGKAKSTMFGQKDERPEPVIMFVTADNKAENISTNLNLRWDGDKGLYLQFLKEYIDFLNNTTQFESEFFMNEMDLYNLKFDQKYFAYGITFLMESLNLKLPLVNKITLKMLSLDIKKNS